MERIYLDANATTPLDEEVLEAMLPLLGETFGNPSSTTWFGRAARRALDVAREQVAALVGAEPDEIVFCSGGTEANNLAILGLARGAGDHVVTSAVEHHAVLRPCEHVERRGGRVTVLPVDGAGLVRLDDAAASIGDDTTLVSIMLANNDVGTIEPVAEIAEVARRRGVPVHTDAVQAVGKIPVDVGDLGVDLLSLSGHKVHGPKGIGALYVRRSVAVSPLLHGGSHERGRRAGTENVAGAVGLGTACALAAARLEADGRRMGELRDHLERGLLARIGGVSINGHPTRRLPNTLDVTLPVADGEVAVMSLDVVGVTVSLGSACSAGSAEPSHVLTAMGLDRETAARSIRISLDRNTTRAQIDRALEAIVEVTETLAA